MTDLLQRTYTGIVFVAIIIAGTILNPFLFAIVFGGILFLVLKEFYEMSEKSGAYSQKIPGLALGLLLFALIFFNVSGYMPKRYILLILPALFLIFIFELFRNKETPLANIGLTLTGIILIAVPFSLIHYLVFPQFLENKQFYPWLLMGIFFILWSYDTGAYLIGIKWGKFKLFERISPNKSWAGVLGGTCVALIVGIINSILFHVINIIGWEGIAVIIIASGTFGDLVESMFKRSLGIKDSGNILPGHGGVLDRLDSLIFSVPFIFAWLLVLNP